MILDQTAGPIQQLPTATTFDAWTWSGQTEITAEGLQWSLPTSRLHYDTTDVRIHYALPKSADHWSISA